MLYNWTFSEYFISRVAVVVLLALLVAAVGCGEAPSSEESTAITIRAPQPQPTTPAPAEIPAARELEPPMEVSFEEAEAAYREARYADASELFGTYALQNDENPWGFYMLGLSAHRIGDHESALSALGQAIVLDSSFVKARLNLGRVLLDSDRADEALFEIEEVFELAPESSVSYRLQGRALYALGEVEDAIAAYYEAIAINPEDAWAMNNLGLIHIEMECFEAALPALARAVELRHDVPVFYNNLGIALERTGYAASAADAYRSAIRLDASYENAGHNLARVGAVGVNEGDAVADLVGLAATFADEVATLRGVVDAGAIGDTDDALEPAEVVVDDANAADLETAVNHQSADRADAQAATADASGKHVAPVAVTETLQEDPHD